MNPETARQRVDADPVLAGCSHSVHFAVREACSRSSTWFRRCADQRVVRLSGWGGILANALIPRGNQPLNSWSSVPVVVDGVHRTHKARTLANGSVGRGSGLVHVCGPGQRVSVDLRIEEHFEGPVVLDAQL